MLISSNHFGQGSLIWQGRQGIEPASRGFGVRVACLRTFAPKLPVCPRPGPHRWEVRRVTGTGEPRRRVCRELAGQSGLELEWEFLGGFKSRCGYRFAIAQHCQSFPTVTVTRIRATEFCLPSFVALWGAAAAPQIRLIMTGRVL